MRKTKFQNEYYYHIYNRGVDKRDIFMDDKDYLKFLFSLREFNTENQVESLRRAKQIKQVLRVLSDERSDSTLGTELVDIIAYCLNPNHYHLLLKQETKNGISKFMQKVGQGYTKYFNLKNNRTGPLVASPFKAKEIKTDYQLQYVSAYINANPEIHKISKADKWTWSSYLDYLEKRKGTLVNKDIILDDFKNVKDYEEYTKEVIKNSQKIKEEIKKCLIEE